MRDGASRVCLYRAESPRAMRHHLIEGSRLPLEGGASARVLRAWSPFARPEDAAVRDNGFALSLGERDPEVAAVAVPVFGPGTMRDLRGALAVSGLITRFDDAAVLRAREALVTGARALEGSIAET